MGRKSQEETGLHCSFCHRSGVRLFSSPSDYPRAYICDKCIATCATILEDDLPHDDLPQADPEESVPHPLLNHPLASEVMASVEAWIVQESMGADASVQIALLRAVARRMLADRSYPGANSAL